ncbi:class I SAM-dependent methyltransferase [Thalassotalea sp. LPB0316]|uniref:class I SAM-dependent methyltransferase n=1 Tax=Thalassotalea sp. LPB0316 TaxID=2769490 RepID=UPI001868A036|nr:class I SAM-dependent methyltransferase [Thalassotalea sp. LPB0316]QOL27155.1 class I SAM-dependent methyltransferase [Thalassotalea sp. LPB0316]
MSNANSWTHYWQQGHLESCIDNQSPDNNEITALWQVFANNLRKDAVVVDLATGNGSVIKKLHAIVPNCHYVGIDYATIAPRWAEQYQHIEFIGNTSIDNIPFETQSVDAITSQFGFEYGLSQQSISELARILKPKGLLQLVVHHSESEIVEPAKLRLQEIEWLIAPNSIVDSLGGFVAETISIAELEGIGKAYLAEHENKLTQSISGQCFSVINQVIQLVENGMATSAAELFERLSASMQQEQKRLSQLISVAQTAHAITEFVASLNDAQLSVESQVIRSNQGNPLAWLIKGYKHG